MIIPLGMVTQSAIGPIGASLQKKYHPRVIMGAGCTLMCSSFFISSYVTSWWVFVFSYGVMFPLGVGIVYYTPMMCAWEWFPERRGMVSGIIVAGYGFGSSITGMISTKIVNPNNLQSSKNAAGIDIFPLEVAQKVPEMLRMLCCFFMVLSVIGIVCITRNPESVQKQKDSEEIALIDDPERETNTVEAKPEDDSITFWEGIKSKQFVQLSALLYFGLFYGLFVASVFKIISSGP